MEPKQVLPLWVSMDLVIMAMNSNFTFPKAPGLEHYHQMQLCHTQDNR